MEVRAVRQIAGGRVDRSDRYAYGRAPKKFPLEGRSVGSFQPPKNLRLSGGEGRSVGFSDPNFFSALRAEGRSVGSFRPEIFPRPLGSGSVGRVFRLKNFRRPPGGRVGRSGPAESEMAKISKVGRSVECVKQIYYFALPLHCLCTVPNSEIRVFQSVIYRAGCKSTRIRII